jgi:hypothetical protein
VAADLNAATLSLTENGTRVDEADVTFTWAESDNSNYIVVTMTPTITLKADQIYTLELYTDTKVLYRDLVYITTKTNKKEVFSYSEPYQEYDDGDDEYIVL